MAHRLISAPSRTRGDAHPESDSSPFRNPNSANAATTSYVRTAQDQLELLDYFSISLRQLARRLPATERPPLDELATEEALDEATKVERQTLSLMLNMRTLGLALAKARADAIVAAEQVLSSSSLSSKNAKASAQAGRAVTAAARAAAAMVADCGRLRARLTELNRQWQEKDAF